MRQNMAAYLTGEEAPLKEGWEISDILCMTFAPTTSADVERSFSKLNYLLSDRRLSLSLENLIMYMKLFYNAQEIV